MAKGNVMKDVSPGTTYEMEQEAEQILQTRIEASPAPEIVQDTKVSTE
jgi:hypothetical protein